MLNWGGQEGMIFSADRVALFLGPSQSAGQKNNFQQTLMAVCTGTGGRTCNTPPVMVGGAGNFPEQKNMSDSTGMDSNVKPSQRKPIFQWPSQEPKKLEVPAIYKAYFLGLCKRISPQFIWPYMVQYLHFRILKFPLNLPSFTAFLREYVRYIASGVNCRDV